MSVIERASVRLLIGVLVYPVCECTSVSVIEMASVRFLIGVLGYPVYE